MESLNSNSQEREREMHQLQQMQDKAKEKCMESFRLLHSHLKVLSIKGGFERACVVLLDQDNQTFTESLLLNLGNLEKQLDREEFQETESIEYTRNRIQQFSKEGKSRILVKALDAGLVVTKSITHAVDADIRPVNDQVPFAEVQLTAQHNVLANEQQHTEQSKPNYDTYLLEKVDSNTTSDSTNMCHRGGEIDQDAEQYQAKSPLLKAEFLKTNDMVEKEVYNELSNRFLQLEKHCISLEISMQQKEESFQSNKPCKNQDAPEFCEFFEINDLKAQLQAKTTLICNLKNQIKSVKEASNEAKVKHDIDVLKTINIELESSVAKLLAENEKLNKENEHLTQTYKELYDSIKKTRIQTKDHNDSLIAQVNSKTVENADLKAQIQEKVFANVALKNELRKLKGNSVDTKFAKPSILGKPVLQPPRNQSVVRQPNAFKSERPNFSKPRFASQVDVINVLSKPVTPHYFPKVREYVLAKPHHVIAPGSSRNSQEEPIQNTANRSKPNPRSNNQISRSLPVSKSSCGMLNGVSLVDHSRNSSSFSDSRHFVCSTCHKCVFNANHDNCITKFLKEVDSRAKVQSPKTRNKNKPVEPKSHTQKPGRQIVIGQRFSPMKTSAVHEKPNTPRSCLRWIPTGRIFKLAGLRWIPTGKMFIDSTTKVDSEPPNGSNEDITNPYKCDQTLNVSAVQASLFNDKWRMQTTLQAPFLKEKKGVRFSALYLQKKRNLLVFDHSHQHSLNFTMLIQSLSGSTYISLYFNSLDQSKMAIAYAIFKGENRLVRNPVSPTPYVPPSKKDYEILFQLLFYEYFNPPPRAVSLDPVAVVAPRAEIQSQVTHQGIEEQIHGHQNAQFDNAPLLHNLSSDPSSEETTLQGSSSNVRQIHTPFEHLGRWTKDHPIANVIGDPSCSVSTRKQLKTDAHWVYFDAFLTSVDPQELSNM
ncbi:hypothetical protein Tco_0952104 [Tanacetum coccineum]|uniref:Uncharacterized protein n=1 Tax=Tanacetum coccineum TaxID=301880 RepID=A0ABQ5E2U7_9ASTR